ncbi:cingulin-like protein 1 isoform X2 [Hemibagrus wyckioides]|uniref:cingulin-like protein 1 isoform X2 n=1 Tax=Hemibagrus wyckioides TaxID=337641 RepID=UPI00266CD341|nr:cingulin-like protein 1 isoform X2 [Hemibagrus wyckioides]
MSACSSTSAFDFVFPEKLSDSAGSLWSLITQSHLRLIDLQRETEREISHVSQQLTSVRLQRKVLNCETAGSETLQADSEHLQRNITSEINSCFVGKAAHAEQLQFREQALNALLSMLGENIQRYREESTKLDHLTEKLSNGMPGKSQTETKMETDNKDMLRSPKNTDILSNGHVDVTSNHVEDEKKNWRASVKASLMKATNLTRSGSVKTLIHKFSVSESSEQITPNVSPSPQQGKDGTGNASESKIPTVTVTSPSGESKNGPNTHSHSGRLNQENGPTSPESEEEPLTPKAINSPKYQMFLGSGPIRNGASGPGGPTDTSANGNLPKSNLSQWKSMESLSMKDWDSGPNKTGGADAPPRVFNSPYSTISLDYNPVGRMSEFKMPENRSPTASEKNLFTLNRSSSPVNFMNAPQGRFSAYATLSRRQMQQAPPSQFLLRNNVPSKRDYIEELTRQLEECQRRNQFLEAESIELEKERTQIRFEMRNLLVNNEDLLRMNTQLQTEMKRMRDRIVELESDNNVMVERFKQIDVELKEAREVMVEANTQEYAFNFLQQSLKNRIQDSEEALEKQTQHVQELTEKLWLAERNLEEMEIERETKGKKSVELKSTIDRLETELAEALQMGSQSTAELSLQQKLRVDAQLRVDELEECVLEKDQELMRLQQIVSRLQGEVSDKLMDKERSLEDEIQLREKIQLQCKQAERTVEDLQMELNTITQTRDDLSKQLKLTQEKVIDLETDVEEWQENEQRLISKHKRAVEQFEQMQVKLMHEKDLNDKLECEKVILERQVRELRGEIEELQNNRVQEHVITKAETRAKELENMLRMEERSKVVLNNTISKLERKINELSEQVEEEHKVANEQKDLMTQRMRSLKRQLNEAEEEASRREAQLRYIQRELGEERESSARLQKQLLDLQLQMKRKESVMMRQTLDNLKLDLSDDDEEEEKREEKKPAEDNSGQK